MCISLLILKYFLSAIYTKLDPIRNLKRAPICAQSHPEIIESITLSTSQRPLLHTHIIFSLKAGRLRIMAAALNKIAATSPSRQHPSELETSIATALYDLESNIPDMKTALRPLQFVSAREVRKNYFFLFSLYWGGFARGCLVLCASLGICAG